MLAGGVAAGEETAVGRGLSGRGGLGGAVDLDVFEIGEIALVERVWKNFDRGFDAVEAGWDLEVAGFDAAVDLVIKLEDFARGFPAVEEEPHADLGTVAEALVEGGTEGVGAIGGEGMVDGHAKLAVLADAFGEVALHGGGGRVGVEGDGGVSDAFGGFKVLLGE